MRDGLFAIVFLIVVFGGLIFGLAMFSNHVDSRREAAIHAKCQERYGSDWVGQYHYRNPDMCVNAQGDVKYLQ